MAELISGPTMVLTWTISSATINIAGDFRTVTWSPSTAYADASAGSDTQVGRMPTLKDATAQIEAVTQTSGTALAAAMQPGQAGTLIIGPEGTASNKRKITLPAYCDGAQFPFPYADVATLSVGFSGSSVLGNYTDGVY